MPGELIFRNTDVSFQDLAEFLKHGGIIEDFAQNRGIDPAVAKRALAEAGAYPNDGALALAFFNAARAEAVQRIGIRETTLTFWIATVGVILGLAVKTQGAPVNAIWLSLVPILSAPFAFLVVRHSLIVTWLSHYVRRDLNDFLRQLRDPPGPFPAGPRHWDNSERFGERITRYLFVENAVYVTLLSVPAIGVDCWMYYWQGFRWDSVWFDLCLVSTLLTLAGFVVVFVLQHRG